MLDRAVENYAKDKSKGEKRKKKLIGMPLLTRLDTMSAYEARITESNFFTIKDKASLISKNQMLKSVRQVNQLRAVINKLIPQTERTENNEFVSDSPSK